MFIDWATQLQLLQHDPGSKKQINFMYFQHSEPYFSCSSKHLEELCSPGKEDNGIPSGNISSGWGEF